MLEEHPSRIAPATNTSRILDDKTKGVFTGIQVQQIAQKRCEADEQDLLLSDNRHGQHQTQLESKLTT